MDTDGGGWTVFQRRQDGSVDFYLNWAEYEAGFGSAGGEFWLGLADIHRLTEGVSSSLRVDLGDAQGNTAYAQYGSFSIGDSTTEYTLSIADFIGGNADDDMITYHNLNGMKFTTKDNDNDNWGDNCATEAQHIAGWWFNVCSFSSLNGPYDGSSYQSISWYPLKNNMESLQFVEMKIRPSQLQEPPQSPSN